MNQLLTYTIEKQRTFRDFLNAMSKMPEFSHEAERIQQVANLISQSIEQMEGMEDATS